MAGIYLHIPFCKHACHYCNFHFSTSLAQKNELVEAMCTELLLQQQYLENEMISTIYFGGGTPSLLEPEQIGTLLQTIYNHYTVAPGAEITLESNPDDIIPEKLKAWKTMGINRLSIGIQSFFEEDLQWMNRAHNAAQARQCIVWAQQEGFNNITIDLIYGSPGLTDERWKINVDTAVSCNVPHLSCYALTVEPKTALHHFIEKKKLADVDPEQQSRQFTLLMEWMEHAGYDHYEISNFGKPGMHSRHNSSYWQGKKYLGIGPSAHSFNGKSRQWNVANNALYTKSLLHNTIPAETETLTEIQQLNEYIMTALRTSDGMNLEKISAVFGVKKEEQILHAVKKYLITGSVTRKGNALMLTRKGKLYADGIAADLFFTHP